MPVSLRTCRGRVRSAEVKVRDEQGGPAEAHAVPRPAEPQHDAHGARVLVAMHGVPSSPACDSSSSSGCTGSSRARPAHGGTRRPTERAWSEDREPGAAPPPPARTDGGGDPGRAGAGGRGRRAARAHRLRARRGEGMPPRLPILASRAPRQPQRPPAGPRARAEAAGVAAEASPPRAGSEGRSPAAGGRRGRRDRRPPQLPRAPAAHRGDAPADAARVERGSGAGRGAPADRPHRVITNPGCRAALPCARARAAGAPHPGAAARGAVRGTPAR